VEESAESRDYSKARAFTEEVRAPDLAEGHLHHQLDQMHHVIIPTGLSSPVQYTLWPPGDWLRATCRLDPEHRPPEEGCRCGIYAVADANRAREYVREAPLTVLAQVGLAGKVIPGTVGWRAERARVVALTRTGVGLSDYPGLFAHVAKRYDVPIFDLDSRIP
jgi:hypothetical protein